MVHIVEQLAAPILVNNPDVGLEWIDEMPVPVMKIDPDIFSPVSHTMLLVEIRRGVVTRNFDRQLYGNERTIGIFSPLKIDGTSKQRWGFRARFFTPREKLNSCLDRISGTKAKELLG